MTVSKLSRFSKVLSCMVRLPSLLSSGCLTGSQFCRASATIDSSSRRAASFIRSACCSIREENSVAMPTNSWFCWEDDSSREATNTAAAEDNCLAQGRLPRALFLVEPQNTSRFVITRRRLGVVEC